VEETQWESEISQCLPMIPKELYETILPEEVKLIAKQQHAYYNVLFKKKGAAELRHPQTHNH